jgi:hypothetical protein
VLLTDYLQIVEPTAISFGSRKAVKTGEQGTRSSPLLVPPNAHPRLIIDLQLTKSEPPPNFF